LLEHPHYTRPAKFRDFEVPSVLRKGNHAEISRWRQEQREFRTKSRRPELYERWLAKQLSLNSKIDSSGFSNLDLKIRKEYDPVEDPWWD